jgi:hypothetical protein
MCRVECEVRDGLIDGQLVGVITAADGSTEEVFAAASLFDDRTLRVSFVTETADRALVELPQESTSGAWRVWVSLDHLHGTVGAR